MRFLKGIGLFFLYPLTMLALGFFAGAETYRFFYPDQGSISESAEPADSGADPERKETQEDGLHKTAQEEEPPEARSVGAYSDTLYVGTEYVLEETDVLRKTVVETTWRLPDRYVGMNREQFLAALEIYEASPPLSELERGFIGLEVLSFSRERVVVRMDYRYVQPGESFYLAAYDNKLVVYLEDKKTVYIETEISLEDLPEEVQQDVIQMKKLEDEEELYGFLETYSS